MEILFNERVSASTSAAALVDRNHLHQSRPSPRSLVERQCGVNDLAIVSESVVSRMRTRRTRVAKDTPRKRNMANSYTRTPVETTAAMSLIPQSAGVLAKHTVQPSARTFFSRLKRRINTRIGKARVCFMPPLSYILRHLAYLPNVTTNLW